MNLLSALHSSVFESKFFLAISLNSWFVDVVVIFLSHLFSLDWFIGKIGSPLI
jgi:hypothetical protein